VATAMESLSLGLSTPVGDPAGLRDTARTLRAAASSIHDVTLGLRSDRTALAQIWTGMAATNCLASALHAVGLGEHASNALASAAVVIDDYAAALEDAQRRARVLETDREAVEATHTLALRAAEADALIDPAGAVSRRALAEEARATAISGLLRDRQAVETALREAAARARAKLDELAAYIGPIAGQSLEARVAGLKEYFLLQFPVLREHPEWVNAAVWASMTQLWTAPFTTFKGGKWLVQFARSGTPKTYPAAPTWANSSITRGVAEKLGGQRAVSVLDHAFVAGTTPNEALFGKGKSLSTLPARAGLARSLGVAGGVIATGASLANVVAQGDPREAWKRNGAEYGADIAETAFNASFTALQVAPNPWTAGATVVTGLTYAGFEIYNHRDDIARLWRESGDVAEQVVGEAQEAAEQAGRAIASGAGKVASVLNPFD
jgi:hypothetical protein